MQAREKAQLWLPGVLRREATVRYDLQFSLRLSSRLSVLIYAWGGRKTWHGWDPRAQSSRLHAVVLGACDCSGPQVQHALFRRIVPWRDGSRENGDGEGRIPCFHSIASLLGGEKAVQGVVRTAEQVSKVLLGVQHNQSALNVDGFSFCPLHQCWVEEAVSISHTSSLPGHCGGEMPDHPFPTPDRVDPHILPQAYNLRPLNRPELSKNTSSSPAA